MGDKFRITIASAGDYEKLVSEISYSGEFIALISQEEGADKLRIEFPDRCSKKGEMAHKVDLDAFLKTVEKARQELLK